MVKKCHYCGELKPCKKGDISYIYNCQDNGSGFLPSLLMPFYFNWICNECSKALEIKYNEYRQEQEEKDKRDKLSWIKQRDKIILENKQMRNLK